MKKRRSFIRRVPALLALAAGIGVAVMATREDGREKLSRFGEFLGSAAENVGSTFTSIRHMVADYAEQMQHRQDASYPSYPTSYQSSLHHNGSQHPNELTHVH
jgi:hypothetical protein